MSMQSLFSFHGRCIWSDNWMEDGDKIWFVAGTDDCLFYIDKETKETRFVSEIPQAHPVGFRGHPICIKTGNGIFCLPDRGENIWRYDADCASWEMIPVPNAEGVRMSCMNAWLDQDKLYVVSRGLRKILELDLQTQEINYHELCTDGEQKVAGSVWKDGWIYIACSDPAGVCKFDCSSKNAEMRLLPEIHDQLRTICFDGRKFWMSGRKKKIYIWEEEADEMKVLDGFPDGFGIYNFSGNYEDVLNFGVEEAEVPMFQASAFAGRHVWFIPFQTNEILYVDKDSCSINVFPVEDETQSEEDMKTQLLAGKYLLEYVWDDRYIGLYSLKNRWALEIDGQELKYRVMDYKINGMKIWMEILDMEKQEKIAQEKEGRIGWNIYRAVKENEAHCPGDGRCLRRHHPVLQRHRGRG